jgi:hypothetical protein
MSTIVTPRAAADLLNVSPRTLSSWRCSGIGPIHLKLCGAVRYRLADLLAFTASSERTATTGAANTPSNPENGA